ncbi:MAG: helix-turn-helix transcriptional regulator [Lachnospiraceae bacterium]|nr:helix-turn-helix transcriptional regulator [Lachnospiraceae bacterium]
MTLGEKITLLRKQKGWSQEELADKLDISRQSVSKWESNASVPDLDKIIKLSVIFSVSTDYLLKDEEQNLPMSEDVVELDGYEEEVPTRKVTMEEATTYMDIIKEISTPFALAVSLCVFSPICMIVMGGLAEFGAIAWSEDRAGSLGMIIMFLFLIVAVPVIIINSLKVSKYEYLEKNKLALEYGVKEAVAERKEAYAPTFYKSIAVGVAIVLAGVLLLVIPAIVYQEEKMVEIGEVYALGAMLTLVAVATFFFVKSSWIYSGFEKLLQEGDYTLEQKRNAKKVEAFSGAYWCIVTAIYLAVSFTENRWESTWVIWPVAAVLFAGVICIINAVSRRKRHS